MKLIVGLGNPGEKYSAVRHNLGFMVVDALARQWGVDGSPRFAGEAGSWSVDKKFQSEILKVQPPPTNGSELLLVKPQTYMNNSGEAVAKIAKYFQVSLEDIVVVHDDLDLPLGRIKVQRGGGAAGHHGVESVIAGLKSEEFIRVRLGAEQDPPAPNPEQFVLEPFLPEDQPEVEKMVKLAAEAIEVLLKEGLDKAQGRFN